MLGAKAASTFTLATPAHVVNVDINYSLEVRSPTGTVRAGGPWIVQKVDRSTGILTLDKPAGSTTTVNDLIYRSGDFGTTAITGLGNRNCLLYTSPSPRD